MGGAMEKQHLLDKFLIELRTTTELSDLDVLFNQFVRDLGFDYSVYIIISSLDITPEDRMRLVLSHHPGEWTDHYLKHNFLSHDRAFVEAFRSTLPFIWDDVKARGDLTKREQKIYDDAAMFGVNYGISVPIHGADGEVAFVTASSGATEDDHKAALAKTKHTLHVASTYFHERIRELGFIKNPLERINPSDRERDCICWASRGKTAWETGQILGISENTVNTHIKTVMKKLNVNNRQEMIAKAVAYNIVMPHDPDTMNLETPFAKRGRTNA